MVLSYRICILKTIAIFAQLCELFLYKNTIFASCIPLFVPYNKKSRHIFVLSAQKRRPRPAPNTQKIRPGPLSWSRSYWWARVDSNHRSIKQQIYSLSPLATREHAPILFSSRRRFAGRLVYFTTGFAVCQQLFQTFPVLCARLPVRPAKGGGGHTPWCSRQRRTACLF